MKSKQTIGLLIIFIGLLAYVYFFEFQKEKHKNEIRRKTDNVVINVHNVVGIKFLPSDITIARKNEWEIIFPIKSRADESTIEKMIQTFNNQEKDRFVSDNPKDFKKFGLSPFQAAMILNFIDGSTDTLFAGDNNLDRTKIFFRKSGSNAVYLINSIVLDYFNKSLYDLRFKSVFNISEKSITKFMIKSENGTFSCNKDTTHGWMLIHPIHDKCDEDRINQILSDCKTAKVKEFVSQNFSNFSHYNLKNPLISVSLFDTVQSKYVTLDIGKFSDNAYYAKNSFFKEIFSVDTNLVKSLNVSLYDLREKFIFNVQFDSVVELKIKNANDFFHFRKDSTNKWWIVEPDSCLAKSWEISSLIYDVNNIKATDFISKSKFTNKQYGLNKPLIDFQIIGNHKVNSKFLIGKVKEKGVFITSNKSNEIYKVENDVIDLFNLKIENFIDNEINN